MRQMRCSINMYMSKVVGRGCVRRQPSEQGCDRRQGTGHVKHWKRRFQRKSLQLKISHYLLLVSNLQILTIFVTPCRIFPNIQIIHPLGQLCIYEAPSLLTDSKHQTNDGVIIKNRLRM